MDRPLPERTEPLLDIEGLSVAYGEAEALSDIDLHMVRGERLIVLGANGAGKTTLLSAIAGLLPAAAGRIHVDGAPVGGLRPHQVARMGVLLVAEGRRVFPSLTARENLHVGGDWVSARERAEQLEQVLELFPRLGERMNQVSGTMSGGERQMLLIGRALMLKPKLLLLDEASQGLAPRVVDEVLTVVERIAEMGVSTLVVEQNTRALRLQGRVLILSRGRLTFEGQSDQPDILERVRQHYLEKAPAAPGTAQ